MNSLDWLPKCFKGLIPFFGFAMTLHIFGSKSSSSSTTNNYETNLTTTTSDDRQLAVEAGIVGTSGDHNITNVEILDGGAINSAFDFAQESQSFWGENFGSVLGLVERTSEGALDASFEVVEANNKMALDSNLASQGIIAKAYSDANDDTGVSKYIPVLTSALVIGGLVFGIKALKG